MELEEESGQMERPPRVVQRVLGWYPLGCFSRDPQAGGGRAVGGTHTGRSATHGAHPPLAEEALPPLKPGQVFKRTETQCTHRHQFTAFKTVDHEIIDNQFEAHRKSRNLSKSG